MAQMSHPYSILGVRGNNTHDNPIAASRRPVLSFIRASQYLLENFNWIFSTKARVPRSVSKTPIVSKHFPEFFSKCKISPRLSRLWKYLNPLKTICMRRTRRRLFNLFAFSLLSFSIYLNFFYKGDLPGLLKAEPKVEETAKHTPYLASSAKQTEKK